MCYSLPLTLFCQRLLQKLCVPAEDLFCKETMLLASASRKLWSGESNFSVDSLREIDLTQNFDLFDPRTALPSGVLNCCLCSNFELPLPFCTELSCSRFVLWYHVKNRIPNSYCRKLIIFRLLVKLLEQVTCSFLQQTLKYIHCSLHKIKILRKLNTTLERNTSTQLFLDNVLGKTQLGKTGATVEGFNYYAVVNMSTNHWMPKLSIRYRNVGKLLVRKISHWSERSDTDHGLAG